MALNLETPPAQYDSAYFERMLRSLEVALADRGQSASGGRDSGNAIAVTDEWQRLWSRADAGATMQSCNLWSPVAATFELSLVDADGNRTTIAAVTGDGMLHLAGQLFVPRGSKIDVRTTTDLADFNNKSATAWALMQLNSQT